VSGVLVVRPSSLGDVVHALAVVADIERARPGLPVDWVAEEALVPLVRLDPGVRRVVPVALRRWRHTPFAAATWREIAAFRRDIASDRYDAIVDLQEQIKGAVIARCARGTRHGPDGRSTREPIAALLHDVHHPIAPRQHFEDRCRQLVAAALGYTAAGPPRFRFVTGAPPCQALAPGAPRVLLVHATSRDDKLWPEASWRLLAAGLGRRGIAAFLPWGSDDEQRRARRIADGIDGAVVLPRLGLPDLASLIRESELVVGVDTGLVHLAAALGTPTIALFVATDPAQAGVAITGPHARDLGVGAGPPSVDDVRSTADALLRAANPA
jgi:heptosyltransferase-1